MKNQNICITVLSTLLLTIKAHPKCETYGGKDVVCTPQDNEYILQRGLVSDTNATTGVTLKGCKISEVDYEAFENMYALKYIDLSVNMISNLKLGVLDGIKAVTYLNMSHNLLVTFPLGLFDQLPNLEVLDLKGNRINNLELGVFDPLSKLKHLDLSSNVLLGKNINMFLFDQSPSITFLDFSRNDMSDAPDELLRGFKALDFINLDRCSLEVVPEFVKNFNLKTLKHLMLSTNRIRKLDRNGMFINLDSLEILNLADNIIDSVNENVFWPSKKLKMVILRNNRITTIGDLLFRDLPKLGNVDLSYNSIGYVSPNAFRNTALKNLNLSHNRLTYLDSNFCLELRNSGARLTKFFFNDNPWQCACLHDILKEVKTYNINYNEAKFNGGTPVCVTKEFNCMRQKDFNDVFLELYDSIRK